MDELFLENKCKNLLNKILKDFPILDKSKIKIIVRPLKIGSMFAKKKLFYYLLIVDPIKYNEANDKQLIGALAHELMHFETYEKGGWFRYIFEWFAFHFSKKLMAKSERENDKNTIKRGYGNELLANRKFRIAKCSKEYLNKIGVCYLTPNEIKIAMEKLI